MNESSVIYYTDLTGKKVYNKWSDNLNVDPKVLKQMSSNLKELMDICETQKVGICYHFSRRFLAIKIISKPLSKYHHFFIVEPFASWKGDYWDKQGNLPDIFVVYKDDILVYVN